MAPEAIGDEEDDGGVEVAAMTAASAVPIEKEAQAEIEEEGRAMHV
jgi:hypothetical protein